MDIRKFFKKKPDAGNSKKKIAKKRVAPSEEEKEVSASDFFAKQTKASPPKKIRTTPPQKTASTATATSPPQKQPPPKKVSPLKKTRVSIIDDSDSDYDVAEDTPMVDGDEEEAIASIPSPPKKSKSEPVRKSSKRPPSIESAAPKSSTTPKPPPPKKPAAKKVAPTKKPTVQQPTRTAPNAPDTERLKPLCLEGLTFCFSGVLATLSRDSASDFVKTLGGRVTGNVSSKTDYLVLGTVLEDGRAVEEGKKYQRAVQEKNVVLVPDEEHLFGLFLQYGETTASATAVVPPVSNPYASSVVPKNPYAKAVRSNPYASKPKSPKQQPPPARLKSEEVEGENVLWVDRHKPTSSREILGNADAVRKLTAWLTSWERTWNKDKKPKTSLNGPFKAALLSGPPGIGKTTTATVVAAEAGRDLLEFNASDVRSKKALQEQVGDITGSQTIQFAAHKQPRQKRCIIMDEVDGMGAGDRSGMAELIQMIKKSRVPIICICNDRQSQKLKSLIPYCLDLRYRRPTKSVIANRAIQIAQKEGLAVEQNAVEAIADSCGNDMRQVLNCLQMWAAKNSTLSYKNVKDREHTTHKDEILRVSLFDATRTIVEGRRGLAGDPSAERSHFFHRNDAYFVDYNFVGLMIHQNYLKVIQQQFNEAKRSDDDTKVLQVLDRTYSAAESMSDWAVAEAHLRGEQNWSILPFTASLAVQTGSFAGGPNGGLLPGFPEFSTWLGRNSSRGKKSRLLGELGHHLNTSVSGGREELRLSYLPVFRNRFLELLQKGEVDAAVHLMDEYGLSRDDVLEKLDEFRLDKQKSGSDSSFDRLDSKTKANLTRTYNQGSHTSQALVTEEQMGKPKRKAGGGAAMVLKDPDAIDEDGDGEEVEEIDDEMDAEAIKALFKSKKKGGRKKAPAAKKAPTKKKSRK